jgi:hypothetical protein
MVMPYVVTNFSRYHSNKVGSSVENRHPDIVVLPDGKLVLINQDVRDNVVMHPENPGREQYYSISKDIRFKVLSQWENDCDRNGSSIRWQVPKGSILRWMRINEDCEISNEIEKEVKI